MQAHLKNKTNKKVSLRPRHCIYSISQMALIPFSCLTPYYHLMPKRRLKKTISWMTRESNPDLLYGKQVSWTISKCHSSEINKGEVTLRGGQNRTMVSSWTQLPRLQFPAFPKIIDVAEALLRGKWATVHWDASTTKKSTLRWTNFPMKSDLSAASFSTSSVAMNSLERIDPRSHNPSNARDPLLEQARVKYWPWETRNRCCQESLEPNPTLDLICGSMSIERYW